MGFLYGFIYLPWFFIWKTCDNRFPYLSNTSLDEKIPFLEIFIIPYGLWFVFIAVTVGYFFSQIRLILLNFQPFSVLE